MRPRIWVPEAPMLNLRPVREVEGPRQRYLLEGFFEVELVHKRTGLIAFHSRFRNLITDAGLDAAGSNSLSTLIVYCGVGTGNATPANADVALGTELARTNANGGFTDTSGTDTTTWYGWRKITRVFTTAQANGNLTEIGMFQNASGGPMWSRSLIKDGSGNPTSITKTTEFELRVTYERRVYPEGGVSDTSYSATVNGGSQTITGRIANSGFLGASGTLYPSASVGSSGYWFAYTGALGLKSAKPAGTEYPATSAVLSSYGSGNFYREITVTWNAAAAVATLLSFANGLFGGGSLTQASESQHQLTTGVAKSNVQKLDLFFRSSWARKP